ncbi:TonB-dependent receptor [Gilvimarinus agarilyticus]|uniref:TonB-dependent receptor n=1 Tax=Gilvimarinus agarilyticus TaxID=679259 RepID=UPI000698F206|nr:TonB-dependent receptor [Gilvimarinus agarilyticus]
MYTPSKLAIAITGLIAGLSFQTQAEEIEPLEEVVVTGIRGSLQRAMDIKRDAAGTVDSISAEDIGKFPDQNVAESLQRIPGVSIDRSGGEGQRITVRGFGPEFNTVLVNGRTMATENQERDFSFDTLASELVSGIDVYKTYSARMMDGGIGSTVNVKTARPFDYNSFKAMASVKGLHESKSGETSPQAAALISSTFADDTVGVLLSLSYQERDARVDELNYRGFLSDIELSDVGGAESSFVQQTNDQIVDFQKRKRTGGTAVVQYAPTDNLTITADAIYSDFDVESDATAIGHWVWDYGNSQVEVDDNGTVVEFAQSASAATDLVARSFNRPTETLGTGLNFDWNVNEELNLQFDISQSEAESKNAGNDIFAVIGFGNDGVTQVNNGEYIELYGVPELDPNDGSSHIANYEGLGIKDEITEIKFDTTWQIDAGIVKTGKFGFSSHERTKTQTDYKTSDDVLCLYCGYQISVPSELLSPFSVDGFMSGADVSNIPTSWLKIDGDAYIDFLASDAAATALDQTIGNEPGTTQAVLSQNNGFIPQYRPDSFSITDDILSAYFEFNLAGQIGSLPWSAELGLRYSQTEMTANGQQASLIGLHEIPNDPTLLRAELTEDVIPVSTENDYSNVLPTANFRLELTEELVARAAYSHTVTRPTFRNIAPQTSYDVLSPNALLASAGNPAVDPFEAKNFDLGVDWYFDDASFVSAAYFYKSVDNFLVVGSRNEIFQNPETGEDVEPTDGSSPVWSVSGVVNSPDTLTVDGLEFAYQQTFDMLPSVFDGLGVMVNATFVNSNKELDIDNINESYALTGLGDSMNFVLFYEKGPIQFRIARNERKEFLQTLRNPTGNNPSYVDNYTQYDMSASYDINDSVTIILEGINLTEEVERTSGRYSNHVVSLVDTGSRYTLGILANF